MATYDKETIIRYVEEELSAGERQRFEADLLKDPALEAEVTLYKEVRQLLQQRLAPDEGAAAFGNTLQDMRAKYFAGGEGVGGVGGSGAKRIPMIRWMAGMTAAASVIIVVALLWPSGKGDYLERLGRTEMISTTERGTNADSLLQQASVYFNQQKFDKAMPLLDRVVQEDSSNQLALFYRGVAGWHTGAVEASRKDLGQVYNGTSAVKYEAAFYIALGYAGQKNNTAAKEWLGKIPAEEPVAEKAKELARKLSE